MKTERPEFRHWYSRMNEAYVNNFEHLIEHVKSLLPELY